MQETLGTGGLPALRRLHALRAGLVAGLTVSTLPAVRSMELALMESRVMSACRSSSATMPL